MSCLSLPTPCPIRKSWLVRSLKEHGGQTRYDSAVEVSVPTLPLPRSNSSKASSETCVSPNSDRQVVTVREIGETPLPAPRIAVIPTSLTYWTSTETRRREYAAIDRASRGLRGLARKVCFRSRYSTFYDEKDGSDVGSVRRFRLDLDALDRLAAESRDLNEDALVKRPIFGWRFRGKPSSEPNWFASLTQFRKPLSIE